MKLKKLITAAVAGTVLTAGVSVAPAATAADNNFTFQKNDAFVDGKPTFTLTGSSLADTLVIGGSVSVGLKALTDNIPGIPEQINTFAHSIGMGDIAGQWNLEQFFRNSDMTDKADQVAALSSGSSTTQQPE